MKETSNTMPTKERIVKATLDIMAVEGFQNVTVRKIATRAGVNIAAVNYHFGSKDVVIDKALKYVTSQMKNVFSILQQTNRDPEMRLRDFVRTYADTVYKYPDIVKYMIDQKIHNSNFQVEYSEFLEEEGVYWLRQTFHELKPAEDPRDYSVRTLQILSCISFPILMGSAIKQISGLDLYDPTIRSDFIECLLDQVLK